MNTEKSGRLPEFTMEALGGMVSGGGDMLCMLDVNTGKKIDYETPEMLLENIHPI